MSKALYWTSASTTRKVTQPYLVMNGMTRKVTRGYNVVGGIAKQFFSATKPNPFESYSGVYTAQRLTVDSAPYILYTLTGSGKLVLKGPARVWMNGGGANGKTATAAGSGASGGYGGGGGYVTSGELKSGEYTVTIGARQGTTSFVHADGTKLSANGATSQNGESGGGGYGNGGAYTSGGGEAGGTGTGKSTYPFGITALSAHSAGGGGGNGAYWVLLANGMTNSINYGKPGNGGSNGSAGGNKNGSQYGSSGGTKGGGAGGGGGWSNTPGGAATFYGSGGGGGGGYADNERDYKSGVGGNGYQGVAYILIPDEGYELAA